MTDEQYTTTSRRRFLKLGAAVAGATALAGCGEGDPDIPDDINPYDYSFVSGKDLADDFPNHVDSKVRTQTWLEDDPRYFKSVDHGKGRLYWANPPETEQDFPVYEQITDEDPGPVREVLGENFHDGTYTDTMLELYGRVESVEDDEVAEFDRWAFVVHDAVLAENSQTTPSTNGTTTGDGA